MDAGYFFVILLIAIVLFLIIIRRVVILEYQKGMMYRQGKFEQLLEPGAHYYLRLTRSVVRVDVRRQSVTISGQEVLTADNISIKISLAATYQLTDPNLAINRVANYHEALYQILQLKLRDVIGALEIDELLAKRAEIGNILLVETVEKAREIGIELILVGIKDVMFPGDLKNIFAQVVNARKEGLASLERARGETAALRNLANAARLLDKNPNLSQLRMLQVLEKHAGNTVVFMPPNGWAAFQNINKSE